MITSAWITIDCGYGHDLNLSPELDGTTTYYGSFFRPFKSVTLTQWTWRDLQIASEYVADRQDYYQAERGFYHVLYQRACMEPNYPMPALRYHLFASSRSGKKGLVLVHENNEQTLTIAIDY